MERYNSEIEVIMRSYYDRLNEREKRHYASIEALKLGHGGKGYVCELFGISYKTVEKGVSEVVDIESLSNFPPDRQRNVGGGRKKFCPRIESK